MVPLSTKWPSAKKVTMPQSHDTSYHVTCLLGQKGGQFRITSDEFQVLQTLRSNQPGTQKTLCQYFSATSASAPSETEKNPRSFKRLASACQNPDKQSSWLYMALHGSTRLASKHLCWLHLDSNNLYNLHLSNSHKCRFIVFFGIPY